MNCIKCKKDIPSDSVFCPYCGGGIFATNKEIAKRRNKIIVKLLVVIILVVCVILIGRAIHIAINEHKQKVKESIIGMDITTARESTTQKDLFNNLGVYGKINKPVMGLEKDVEEGYSFWDDGTYVHMVDNVVKDAGHYSFDSDILQFKEYNGTRYEAVSYNSFIYVKQKGDVEPNGIVPTKNTFSMSVSDEKGHELSFYEDGTLYVDGEAGKYERDGYIIRGQLENREIYTWTVANGLLYLNIFEFNASVSSSFDDYLYAANEYYHYESLDDYQKYMFEHRYRPTLDSINLKYYLGK